MHDPETDQAVQSQAVDNHHEQSSIWPVKRKRPARWESAGKPGSREQFL